MTQLTLNPTRLPSVHFVISRVVVDISEIKNPYGTEKAYNLEVQSGTYNSGCNLKTFNETFGRYGIPEGWTVTAVAMSVFKGHHDKSENYPEHLRVLFSQSVTSNDGVIARWQDDFRRCFNLDRNFDPIQ